MFLNDYIKAKCLGVTGGVGSLPDSPKNISQKLMFVNDIEAISIMQIHEYDALYSGDEDQIRMFYTQANTFFFNFEPFYDKNKKQYFWSVASTEGDVKCTHSGLPKVVIDTLANIIDYPMVSSGHTTLGGPITDKIRDIEKANNFEYIFKKTAIPKVLVEGWGDFKISWDLKWSDHPIIQFYGAENVDFVYIYDNLHIATIYKDYYCIGLDKFVVIETRRLDPTGVYARGQRFNLVIEKEIFKTDESGNLINIGKEEKDKLFPNVDVEHKIIIISCEKLLSIPVILFPDPTHLGYGLSIYAGKCGISDDLDQCLSMMSMATRRSSPTTMINSEYLERDKNGLPIAPKTFDRKYVIYKGGKDASGSSTKADPVTVDQPKTDFKSLMEEAIFLTLEFIKGLMAPGTLGMSGNASAKDNADAEREKEKITIFTRNAILELLVPILKDLFSQSLMVESYISKILVSDNNPTIDQKDYDISVDFEEFADASYENKVQVLGNIYSSKLISPRLFIEKLYKNSLSKEAKDKEIDYLKKVADYENGEVDTTSSGSATTPMIPTPPTSGQADKTATSDLDLNPDNNVTNQESKDKSQADVTNASYNRLNEQH